METIFGVVSGSLIGLVAATVFQIMAFPAIDRVLKNVYHKQVSGPITVQRGSNARQAVQ